MTDLELFEEWALTQEYVDGEEKIKDGAWDGWRAALRSVRRQEPVAWSILVAGEPCDVFMNKDTAISECARRDKQYPEPSRKLVPLYAAAPQVQQEPVTWLHQDDAENALCFAGAGDDKVILAKLKERGIWLAKFNTAPPAARLTPDECQYAKDVGMPEYRCAVKCQYDAARLTPEQVEPVSLGALLDEYLRAGREAYKVGRETERVSKARRAIVAAFHASQPAQEPVAWLWVVNGIRRQAFTVPSIAEEYRQAGGGEIIPLYAAAPHILSGQP